MAISALTISTSVSIGDCGSDTGSLLSNATKIGLCGRWRKDMSNERTLPSKSLSERSLMERIRAAYKKVEVFPEQRDDGFMDLIVLRNLVGQWLDGNEATANETFVPLRAPDAQGWTLDNRLIRAIHDECRGDDFCPSDEGIELVLLAFEKLTARRLADYGPALKANTCQCDPNPSIGGSPPCPVHDGESETGDVTQCDKCDGYGERAGLKCCACSGTGKGEPPRCEKCQWRHHPLTSCSPSSEEASP